MYDNAEEVRENEKRNLPKIENPGNVAVGMAHGIQDEVSAAAKVAEDYRSKVFEYMKGNVNAALDYANSLASVKSPAELVGLSAGPTRKPRPDTPKPAAGENVPSATQAAEEYRARLFEIMKANVNATLEYAHRLANVKSPAEFVALSTTHARKQLEAIAAQTAEIGLLTQKLAASNTEQMAEGFTKVLTGLQKR
jgi:hypothetical protein